jgi:hypothetical protein
MLRIGKALFYFPKPRFNHTISYCKLDANSVLEQPRMKSKLPMQLACQFLMFLAENI